MLLLPAITTVVDGQHPQGQKTSLMPTQRTEAINRRRGRFRKSDNSLKPGTHPAPAKTKRMSTQFQP